MTDLFFATPEPARGILRLTGDDRVAFLQGLVSNDVHKVGPDRAIWAALLTPQGKYLHDFFIAAAGDSLLLDTASDRLDDLRRRLSLYKLRAKVAIADASAELAVWQGWGGGAARALGLAGQGDAAALDGGVALVDPRLGELGVRAVLPRDSGAATLTARGFVPSDWAGWDRLRLSLGIPDGSRDMELDKAILLENGFDELNGVSWDKGCYMGQELTARTKYRGLVKKRLTPVRLDGALPAPGTIVTRPDGGEAGEIRSGRGDLALALLRLDAAGLALSAGNTAVHPSKPGWARW